MSSFEETMQHNAARYAAISHLTSKFEWEKIPGYAHFQYKAVTTDPEAASLSAQDVMLLADSGNLCFGGRNALKRQAGDKTIFSGTVHTD